MTVKDAERMYFIVTKLVEVKEFSNAYEAERELHKSAMAAVATHTAIDDSRILKIALKTFKLKYPRMDKDLVSNKVISKITKETKEKNS